MFLIFMAAYLVTGVVMMPRMARWQLESFGNNPEEFTHKDYVRNHSEARLIQIAGQRAAVDALMWPWPLGQRYAVAPLVADAMRRKAAADEAKTQAENRRIIKEHEEAEKRSFDAALNKPERDAALARRQQRELDPWGAYPNKASANQAAAQRRFERQSQMNPGIYESYAVAEALCVNGEWVKPIGGGRYRIMPTEMDLRKDGLI